MQRLSHESECFAAGRKDLEVGAILQQCLYELGAGIEEMLAIIKNQQQGLWLQKLNEPLGEHVLR